MVEQTAVLSTVLHCGQMLSELQYNEYYIISITKRRSGQVRSGSWPQQPPVCSAYSYTSCRFTSLNLMVMHNTLQLVQTVLLLFVKWKMWSLKYWDLTLSALRPLPKEPAPSFCYSSSKVMGAPLNAGYPLKYITCSPHTLHTYRDVNNWYYVRIWLHLMHYFSFSTYWKMNNNKKLGFFGGCFCKTETTQFGHLCQCRYSDWLPTCVHLNLAFYLLYLGHTHSRCLCLQTLHLELVWWCTALACSLCWTKLRENPPDFIWTTLPKWRSMFEKQVAHSSLPVLMFMHNKFLTHRTG